MKRAADGRAVSQRAVKPAREVYGRPVLDAPVRSDGVVEHQAKRLRLIFRMASVEEHETRVPVQFLEQGRQLPAVRWPAVSILALEDDSLTLAPMAAEVDNIRPSFEQGRGKVPYPGVELRLKQAEGGAVSALLKRVPNLAELSTQFQPCSVVRVSGEKENFDFP